MHEPADSPAQVRARLTAALEGLTGLPPAPLPPLDLVPMMGLARGRVHEVCGLSRHVLALALAGRAQAEGPVLWLRPSWGAEGFHPRGMRPFADPGALIFVACPRAPDILWTAEEALSSGAVALVVAELAAPPDLRQVRRLHRAAAAGVARAGGLAGVGKGQCAPLGVLTMQERADSRIAGVESRWALHPLLAAGADRPAWRLERLQARAAPPGAWPLRAGPHGLEQDQA
ncbi:hypothetical protein [Pararhodobacter sp. SW119]|uniref:hypothetical protein n=1 Tax=Pararhodobacter sp. SW119 TaxID=2780075 RepID=UPI001FD82485|nr:hypothetical protein [Pararhodobacter sp. SW119]